MRLSYKPFHVCALQGCYSLTRTHDYCKYHQYKLEKYGDPEYKKPRKVKK